MSPKCLRTLSFFFTAMLTVNIAACKTETSKLSDAEPYTPPPPNKINGTFAKYANACHGGTINILNSSPIISKDGYAKVIYTGDSYSERDDEVSCFFVLAKNSGGQYQISGSHKIGKMLASEGPIYRPFGGSGKPASYTLEWEVLNSNSTQANFTLRCDMTRATDGNPEANFIRAFVRILSGGQFNSYEKSQGAFAKISISNIQQCMN